MDGDLGRLARLAQQRDLVDRHRLDGLPADGACRHFQRTKLDQLRGGETRRQIGLVILVHEEADGAAIHAEDRDAPPDEPVQGLEHHAVAAQGDDDIGLIRGHMGVARLQLEECAARLVVVGGQESDAQRLRGSVGHGATIATCQVGGEPPSSLPPLSQGEFGYA